MKLSSTSIPQGIILSSPEELPQIPKFFCQLRENYLLPPLTPSLKIRLTFGVQCEELATWAPYIQAGRC